MNDDLHEFEKELQDLRPSPVSPDLRGRIARELDLPSDVRPVPRIGGHPLRTATWLAAAAIVLLALGLAWWQKYGTVVPAGPGLKKAPDIALQDSPPEDVQMPPRPTRWAYQLALADSPERLDALLDQHAAMLLPPAPKLERVGALIP